MDLQFNSHEGLEVEDCDSVRRRVVHSMLYREMTWSSAQMSYAWSKS